MRLSSIFKAYLSLKILCLRIKMSKVLMLRVAVKQRATAAAEEISELFEKALAELEEEVRLLKDENEEQRKVLEAVFNHPRKIHRADVQQLLKRKKEVSPERLHKNEQVKPGRSQDGEKFQRLVGVDNPSSIAEGCGGSEHQTLRHGTGTKPLSCPLCNETFLHEMYLTIHMGEQHAGEKPISSFVCEKSFATITQLSEHECVDESSQMGEGGPEAAGNSHPDGSLPQLSDEGAPDRAETLFSGDSIESWEPQSCLKAPSKSCTASKFVCSLCGKELKRRKGLVSHMRMHSVSRNAICRVCHKKFTFQSKQRTYTCLCEPFQHQQIRPEVKAAPAASSLSEPMQTEADGQSDVDGNSHPDGLIPPLSDEETSDSAETGFSEPQADFISLKNKKCDLRCNTDKKSFNSSTFGCSLCCKAFVTRTKLMAHMRHHSGPSRTKCRVCKNKFEFHAERNTYTCSCESSQLPPADGPTKHAGEEPFSCHVCGKSFTTVTQLDEHRSMDSGGSKETVDRMTVMRRSEAKKLLGSYSGFECNEEMQTDTDVNDSEGSKPSRKSVRIRTMTCRDDKESFGLDSCSGRSSIEEVKPFSYPYYSQGFSYNPAPISDLSEYIGEKSLDTGFTTKRSLCNPSQLLQRQSEQMQTGADGGSESEGNSLLVKHRTNDRSREKGPIRHTSVQTNLPEEAEQEPPHIKEEHEEHWISQEGEQLQGLVVVEIPSSRVTNG